jgi:hypothetical protein
LTWFYRITSVGPQRGVGNPEIKSTPLVVNGILYFTIPDHVWAVDARTGEEVWHFAWKDQGGHLVGNRGVGMYSDWIYFMTPCSMVMANLADVRGPDFGPDARRGKTGRYADAGSTAERTCSRVRGDGKRRRWSYHRFGSGNGWSANRRLKRA